VGWRRSLLPWIYLRQQLQQLFLVGYWLLVLVRCDLLPRPQPKLLCLRILNKLALATG
jgi:hypothetical protein